MLTAGRVVRTGLSGAGGAMEWGWLAALLLFVGASGCEGGKAPHGLNFSALTSRVTTDWVRVNSPTGISQRFDRPHLRDSFGRYVHLRGVNVSGSNKWPGTEDFERLQLWKDGDGKFVSYEGKPFPIEEADKHFGQLTGMGFNSIRLIMNWEAIMPDGPDELDEGYLDYIEQLVTKAEEHGIYVLLDMHQDIASRHIFSRYNMNPVDSKGKRYEAGSMEGMLLGLLPAPEVGENSGADYREYNNWYRGDGFPRWVVELVLREKNLDAATWGYPKLLADLKTTDLMPLLGLLQKFLPAGEGGEESALALLQELDAGLKRVPDFDITETSDILPWTMWGVNGALSLDVQRIFATFFAGDEIYPEYMVEGQSIKDYLQAAYIRAFVAVAERVKGRSNIIGYDLMNEPIGFFLVMSAVAAYFDTGLESTVEGLLISLLGPTDGAAVFEVLLALKVLPEDRSDETRRKWGFEGANLGAMVGLNIGFDSKYLQVFYEKLGRAIQEVDRDAIIWFELSSGLSLVTGDGGVQTWAQNPRKLEGVKQQVFAPHWYPDIYPFLGINQPPREFNENEWKYRDFRDNIEAIYNKSRFSLGNIPVVFGEFGTYFNFDGIDKSKASDYLISAQILDNYYRAFEELNISNMVWCWSPENSHEYGEGWDLEDFSIVGPELKPRGEYAYVRPYARATSGELVQSRFYGPYGYLDPEKGEALPTGEFYMEMKSKEVDAATELFVPVLQYPTGFYVWVSDGRCYYDDARQLLHWYPDEDGPEVTHWVRLRPPNPAGAADMEGWSYFFRGDKVLQKGGR